jgi:uncharacterized membrane protein YtjA (UPF0391 family)
MDDLAKLNAVGKALRSLRSGAPIPLRRDRTWPDPMLTSKESDSAGELSSAEDKLEAMENLPAENYASVFLVLAIVAAVVGFWLAVAVIADIAKILFFAFVMLVCTS